MFTRASRRAVRTLNSTTRQYATQPTIAAANGSRMAIQPGHKSEQASKRPQSTVASSTAVNQRPVPSPAFNKADNPKVQKLKPEEAELDHSFVGMTGGQIFAEMMLRNGVECICELDKVRDKNEANVFSWLSWRSHSPRLRCHIPISEL
jgi:acetolactate synthase I/II/III large subunit